MNFYAIVLDATFPHKSFKSKRYLVTLKIADLTSKFNNEGIVDFTSIVFFANKFDDLPVCQKVGDIIRVHRATVGTYKDRKQLTANVCFNSSWALFPAQFFSPEASVKKQTIQDEFCPNVFFGKSCQVEREEHKLIRGLRKWVKDNFANKLVLSN